MTGLEVYHVGQERAEGRVAGAAGKVKEAADWADCGEKRGIARRGNATCFPSTQIGKPLAKIVEKQALEKVNE
jgi:hypothetical protein